jgi:hypothetical protein
MVWRVTPDRAGTPAEAPRMAGYYREQAGAIRAIAARTSVREIRRQLLGIADQYDRLAEHADARADHDADVPHDVDVR